MIACVHQVQIRDAALSVAPSSTRTQIDRLCWWGGILVDVSMGTYCGKIPEDVGRILRLTSEAEAKTGDRKGENVARGVLGRP